MSYNTYMASITISREVPLIDLVSKNEFDQAVNKQAEIIKKKSHLGGLSYFFMLGICIIKDLLDLAWTALAVVGLGLSATVVGALVGIPLFVFAKALAVLCGLGVSMLILTYLFATDSTTGVGIAGKVIARRLIIPFIILIIDSMVPGVEALPVTTICFIFTLIIENRIRKGGALGAATKFVVKELSSRKMPFHQKFNVKEMPYQYFVKSN